VNCLPFPIFSVFWTHWKHYCRNPCYRSHSLPSPVLFSSQWAISFAACRFFSGSARGVYGSPRCFLFSRGLCRSFLPELHSRFLLPCFFDRPIFFRFNRLIFASLSPPQSRRTPPPISLGCDSDCFPVFLRNFELPVLPLNIIPLFFFFLNWM